MTIAYFISLSLIIFLGPQFLVKFLGVVGEKSQNLIYLFLAACLPLIWIFVPKEFVQLREVNFLQHFVGGGVAVGLVSVYFIKVFSKYEGLLGFLNNFFVQILFVYMLVSCLGVANELLEFLLDSFKIGIFSSDRYDTWFDLFANTSGAFLVFLIYTFMVHFKKLLNS